MQGQEGDLSNSQRKEGNKSEANEQVKHGCISSVVAIQEACETWRVRCFFDIKTIGGQIVCVLLVCCILGILSCFMLITRTSLSGVSIWYLYVMAFNL